MKKNIISGAIVALVALGAILLVRAYPHSNNLPEDDFLVSSSLFVDENGTTVPVFFFTDTLVFSHPELGEHELFLQKDTTPTTYTNSDSSVTLTLSGSTLTILSSSTRVFTGSLYDSTFYDEKGTPLSEDEVGSLDTTQETPSPKVTPQDASFIMNHTWHWIQTTDANGRTLTPLKPGIFSITFKDTNDMYGTTDCNNFSGTFSKSEQSLTFSPFSSTMMYCEQSQEADFHQILSQTTSFKKSSTGELILIGGEGSVSLFQKK